MRTEQLQYFREVARSGSINSAAKKLHISQQGLNSMLKSLEEDLDATLFTTSRLGISLTPQGKILLDYTDQLLTTLDALNIALAESKRAAKVSDDISICLAPIVSEYLFPHIFNTLTNNYPNISVQLTEAPPFSIIESIKNNEFDLGILGIQYTLLDKLSITSLLSSETSFTPLYQYKIQLAVGRQHPLASHKSVSIKTILKYPLVFHVSHELADEQNYHWLQLYGDPQIKYTTNSPKIYLNIIAKGSAIGFFPQSRHCNFKISVDEDIVLIPIKDDSAVHTVGYLYNSTLPVSPAMEVVMKELESFCK